MWEFRVKEIYKNVWHKVIYNNYTKENVVIVDNLNEEFIKNIIENHNNTLIKWYKDGLKDGVEIRKNQTN